MGNKKWTLDVKYDEEADDHIIELPDDLMAAAGWDVGDDIKWIDNKDGSWTMKKIKDKEWVLVECISQFRQRYMVEVPKGKAEWALDTVTMQEAKEFSQEHLGETIISHRIVTKREALEMCDRDNDYAQKWNDDHKIKTFFTRDREKVNHDPELAEYTKVQKMYTFKQEGGKCGRCGLTREQLGGHKCYDDYCGMK